MKDLLEKNLEFLVGKGFMNMAVCMCVCIYMLCIYIFI